MGFSLSGRVLHAQGGKGIKDVTIKVDGKEKAVTDADGYIIHSSDNSKGL